MEFKNNDLNLLYEQLNKKRNIDYKHLCFLLENIVNKNEKYIERKKKNPFFKLNFNAGDWRVIEAKIKTKLLNNINQLKYNNMIGLDKKKQLEKFDIILKILTSYFLINRQIEDLECY
jgi:hypothetical protein